MRQIWILTAVLAAVLAVAGCSGSASLPSAPDAKAADGFALFVAPASYLEGSSAQGFELQTKPEGDGITVSVAIGEAHSLRALYLELRYDPRRFRPADAVPSGVLGDEDHTLSLAVLDRPGAAYLGQVLIHPYTQPGFSGRGVVATFHFEPAPLDWASTRRSVAAAPTNDLSATVLALDVALSRLNWGFYSTGDYDQNGETNISDLTPIAQHFMASAGGGTFSPDTINAVVDGDNNGEVNLGDITPIGANFQRRVQSYNIYKSANASDAPAENGDPSAISPLASMQLNQATGTPAAGRLHFSYSVASLVGDYYYWVRPADTSSEGTPSNVLHYNGTPPPEPPTLTLTNPPGIGSGTSADPYIADKAIDYIFSLTDTTDGDVSTSSQSVYIVNPGTAGTISNTDATLNIDDAFEGDLNIGATYQGRSATQVIYMQVPGPPPGEFGKVDIDLPSDSTGGGNLAVRMWAPNTGDEHFADGAPVLIWVDGGNSMGSLAMAVPQFLDGFINISFVFPGGSSDGRGSAGSYDDRGQSCIDALRDVCQFAMGSKTDSEGHTISQILAATVLTGNVGLYGSSNGGSICTVVMAQYGATLTGVKYMMLFESPSNGQTVCTDLGPGNNLSGGPPAPGPLPRYINPYYLGYATPVCNVDYSKIQAQASKIFLDGDSNGTYDTQPYGNYTIPLDKHSTKLILEQDEDFAFDYLYLQGGKRHFSLEVVQALWDNNIFPHATWPADLDTPPQADTFWSNRDAARNLGALATARPDLRLLLMFYDVDHVQTARDKPHVRQFYDGFFDNSMWVKLNPAKSSLVALDGGLSGDSNIPDNAVNTAPANWDSLNLPPAPPNYDYAEPSSVSQAVLDAGSAIEMATLIHP